MSNECDRSPTYLSYMLRLWQAGSRDGKSVWRASLEDPHTGERLAFGGVEALVTFLVEKTCTPLGTGNMRGSSEHMGGPEDRTIP